MAISTRNVQAATPDWSQRVEITIAATSAKKLRLVRKFQLPITENRTLPSPYTDGRRLCPIPCLWYECWWVKNPFYIKSQTATISMTRRKYVHITGSKRIRKDNGTETRTNWQKISKRCAETQQWRWGIDDSADLRSRRHGQKHAPKQRKKRR